MRSVRSCITKFGKKKATTCGSWQHASSDGRGTKRAWARNRTSRTGNQSGSLAPPPVLEAMGRLSAIVHAQDHEATTRLSDRPPRRSPRAESWPLSLVEPRRGTNVRDQSRDKAEVFHLGISWKSEAGLSCLEAVHFSHMDRPEKEAIQYPLSHL